CKAPPRPRRVATAGGCRPRARASPRTTRRPIAPDAPTSTAPTPTASAAKPLIGSPRTAGFHADSPRLAAAARTPAPPRPRAPPPPRTPPRRVRAPPRARVRREPKSGTGKGPAMTKEAPALTRGLEGVAPADPRLCDLDGKNGRLAYVGYDIDELARKATF